MRSFLRQSGALSLAAVMCALLTTVRLEGQSPWNDADIGSPFIFGSSWHFGDYFGLIGGGSGFAGTSDQFHFLSQRLSGDVDIKACIDFVSGADPALSTGVMVRESLDPAAPAVAVLLSPDKGVALQLRRASGSDVEVGDYSAGSAPTCVRLVRQGATFTAYFSDTGASWTRRWRAMPA